MLRQISSIAATLLFFGVASAQSQESASSDLNVARNAAMVSHNALRRNHGSPAVNLNEQLSATAQAWAEQIAKTGELRHSTPEFRNGAGENLFVTYTTEPPSADALAKMAVQSWYDEVKNYDFSKPEFGATTGHFTQTVWKGSASIGLGVARGTKTINGATYHALYVVCQYSPSGNIRGMFSANVLKGPGDDSAPAAPAASETGSSPAPVVSSVSFREAKEPKVGVVMIETANVTGNLAVEVNGVRIAPPLEVVSRAESGFVRVKGTFRELNLRKGTNSVVYIVNEVKSATLTFTH